MPYVDNEKTILRLRCRAQGLADPRAESTGEVLQRVGAIQAQDLAASRLALRARSASITADAVARACNEERVVVRTWLLRGTLHMVLAEDVRWLLRLLGPAVLASDRRRRLQLGLDDALCLRALDALREMLRGGAALVRADLVGALAASGVVIDPKSQAPAHLVAYAALHGLIARGADRADGEPTYVLLDDWIDPQRDRRPEDDLAALARLYLTAYGPATADDLAAWAGIPLRSARQAIERIAHELSELPIGDARGWMLASTAPIDDDAAPVLRLLPAFDAYLLGYRRRDLALEPCYAKRVNAGGGWLHPVVLLDGRVIGIWKLARHRAGVSVTVSPFDHFDAALLPLLEAEVADVGRFLGASATLTVLP